MSLSDRSNSKSITSRTGWERQAALIQWHRHPIANPCYALVMQWLYLNQKRAQRSAGTKLATSHVSLDEVGNYNNRLKEYTTRHGLEGGEDNWPKVFLSLPVEYRPGTWFVYNTGATYMLSAIITRLTGEPLLEYLRPRLFEPLGIENPVWETDPRGINVGGSGLHTTTEDIARFGQMYLQKGMWNGTRIVTEEWIAEAAKPTPTTATTQTNPDWTVGYGYQFWRCRHNCYRGDGAFGQYCIVMPEQDAVLALIGGLQNMQTVLDVVWQHLLPAMQSKALPADPQGYGALCEKLAVLSLPLSNGHPSSPRSNQWSGKTYKPESPAESSFPQERNRSRTIATAAWAITLDALAGPHGSASRRTRHTNN